MIRNLIGLGLPIRWCEYNFFSWSEDILDSFLLFVECYTSAFCINHFLARFHAYLFLLHMYMHYLHAIMRISTNLNICSWTKNPAVHNTNGAYWESVSLKKPSAIIVIGSLLYFEWYIYTFLLYLDIIHGIDLNFMYL